MSIDRAVRPGGLLLLLALALALPGAFARADVGGASLPPPRAAPADNDSDLPKAGPRGDHVTPSKLPPFFGIFGSADLIAKVGFRGSPGSYIEFLPDAATAERVGEKGLRIAQVGPPVAGSRWFEITGIGPGAEGVAMRILTTGERLGNVQRLIVQGPNLPPMELPLESLSTDMPLATPGGNAGASLLSDARHLGSEKVHVPIGTFQAEHWLVASGKGHRLEIWTTRDQRVPFTGCVKMKTDQGVEVATKVGTDAVPVVSVPPARQE